MAATSVTTPANLLTERAATAISFYRSTHQMGENTVNTMFTVQISHAEGQYLVDEEENKLRIVTYNQNAATFSLTPEQVGELFMLPVKLSDNTETTLGELIADKADEYINLSLAAPAAGSLPVGQP